MLELNTPEILEQTAKLKYKMEKYPPFALNAGLTTAADYLNSPLVKLDIYPPSQSGAPFVWSSEKQRRYVMANIKLPSTRNFNLANSGSFKVDQSRSSLYVFYQNVAPYAKWVIGQFTQIIGHITRGWKPVNTVVVDRYHDEVINRFHDAVIQAWDNDQFMSGGAPGL